MDLLMIALSFSLLIYSVVAVPFEILSEPSPQLVESIERTPPGFYSPLVDVALDFADALLINSQRAVDGDQVRMSQIMSDFHSVLSSSCTQESFSKTLFPKYMSNCFGKESCVPMLTSDFCSPVYLPGRSLEDMLREHESRIKYLPMDQMEMVPDAKLCRVLLPFQIPLLRIMKALVAISADEWRELIGRGAQGIGKSIELLTYLFETAIPDDPTLAAFEEGSSSQEFLAAIDYKFGNLKVDDSKAKRVPSFYYLLRKHGVAGLFMAAPMLSSKLREMARSVHLPVDPPMPYKPHGKVLLKCVSPTKYAAFLLSLWQRMADDYNVGLAVDPAKFVFDVDINLLLGIMLDGSRVLFAICQGIVERDTALQMSAKEQSFPEYIKNLKRDPEFDSIPIIDDPVFGLFSLLKDPRLRRVLESYVYGGAGFINRLAGGAVIDPDTVDRWTSSLRSSEHLGKIFFDDEERSKAVSSFLKDPRNGWPSTLKSLSSNPDSLVGSSANWLNWMYEKVRDKVLTWMKLWTFAAKITGYHVEEMIILRKVLIPLIGVQYTGMFISDEHLEQIRWTKRPDWAIQFDHSEITSYFSNLYTALLPVSSDDPKSPFYLETVRDGVPVIYQVCSLKYIYNSVLPSFRASLASRAAAMNLSEASDMSFGLLSTIYSIVSFAKKVPILGNNIVNSIDTMISPLIGEDSLAGEIRAILDDFDNSSFGKATKDFFKLLPVLHEEAGAWRAQKESVLRDKRVIAQQVILQPPSFLLLYLTRLVLTLTAFVIISASLLVLFGYSKTIDEMKVQAKGVSWKLPNNFNAIFSKRVKKE